MKTHKSSITHPHQKRKKLLNIFIKNRTDKALDYAARTDRHYQNALKQQDMLLDRLDKAGLGNNQKSLIDDILSASNDCLAAYGAAAYRLGFYDGIRLLSEIKDLSV